jgi:phosphate transport system substrate-binding protein
LAWESLRGIVIDTGRDITVISREDGSGTRGASSSCSAWSSKDESGTKIDMTTDEAVRHQQHRRVPDDGGGNEYAIGYISLGSLNDTVKALKIDGADATAVKHRIGANTRSRVRSTS